MSRILIIGGTGSLGRKLIERLLPHNEVDVYSRDEAKHWTIKNELSASNLSSRLSHLTAHVGDVRDITRLRDVIRSTRPDTVIVAAALKHVDTCEMSPQESVATNLSGTQNVIEATKDVASFAGTVLFVSTDKACSPVNVYGMCKAISERMITSQAQRDDGRIRYLAVRYGNVLESRGSIIPLFKYQGEHNDFLTVTDPNMTRFLMTLDDSVTLIQHALDHGRSGETWVPILPAMRIGDLADIFSQRYGKPVLTIGLRPGEKTHEDLINASESGRTTRWGKPSQTHYVIGPAYLPGRSGSFTYSSNDSVMSKSDLLKHLTSLNVLDASLDQFKGLSIEEIATNRRL